MLSTTNLTIALLMAALTSATKLEHQPLTLAQLVAQTQDGDCCNSCCNTCEEEPEQPEEPEEPVEPEIADPPEEESDGETEIIPDIVIPDKPEPEVSKVPELEPEDTLEDLFKSANGRPVVLDFQYDACDPCARIAPDFEKLMEAYPEVIFRNVDIYSHRDLLQELGVRQTPTFKIFIDGEEESTVVGDSLADLTAEIISAIDIYKANQEADGEAGGEE